MVVTLVKETKIGEKRVLLLPKQIRLLSNYCAVQVEESAGENLEIDDWEYKKAGAKIVSQKIAWSETDLILKLKCPSVDEILRMKPRKSILALFHAEIAPEIIDIIVRKEITAYSFEYFRNSLGQFPLMKATGELAGQQAVTFAAYHLQSHIGGSGIQLAKSSFVKGATIAILGYGNVGKAAAEMAVNLGANVLIFRWNKNNSSKIKINSKEIKTFPWDKKIAEKIIPKCDVVIGSIRISTFDTPNFIDKELIKRMRPGSLIIDVTAGYGKGYMGAFKKTTSLKYPFKIINGVKYFKIRELPLGIHKTAAEQISRVYYPYIKKLIIALTTNKKYFPAENGIIINNGKITNSQISKHYALRYSE